MKENPKKEKLGALRATMSDTDWKEVQLTSSWHESIHLTCSNIVLYQTRNVKQMEASVLPTSPKSDSVPGGSSVD